MHIAAELFDLLHDFFEGKTLLFQFYQFLHDLGLTTAGGLGIDDVDLLLPVFFPIQIHTKHRTVVASAEVGG